MPLRSTGITLLHRYYEHSESCQASVCAIEAQTPSFLPDRPPCFTYPAFASIPSPNTRSPPDDAFAHDPSARQAPRTTRVQASLSRLQARRTTRPYRVRLYYGLDARLLLLSTPPRGDAVAVDYWPERVCMPQGDFHPSDQVRLQAYNPLLQEGDDRGAIRGRSPLPPCSLPSLRVGSLS